MPYDFMVFKCEMAGVVNFTYSYSEYTKNKLTAPLFCVLKTAVQIKRTPGGPLTHFPGRGE